MLSLTRPFLFSIDTKNYDKVSFYIKWIDTSVGKNYSSGISLNSLEKRTFSCIIRSCTKLVTYDRGFSQPIIQMHLGKFQETCDYYCQDIAYLG